MLLTAEEVADFLQVPKSWVYEAAREGRIPHIRLGRYVRFDQADIEQWLSTLRSNAREYQPRRHPPLG